MLPRLWSSGNRFSGVMNPTSGSLIEESGFGRTHGKFGGGGIMVWWGFQGLDTLVPREGKQFGEDPLVFQHPQA